MCIAQFMLLTKRVIENGIVRSRGGGYEETRELMFVPIGVLGFGALVISNLFKVSS